MIALRFASLKSFRLMIVLSVAVVALFVLMAGLPADQSVSAIGADAKASTAEPQASYLYRFDPISQTFFTLTLPTGSAPQGVAVTGTNPTHVWVAEYGRDRIGHLVYTSTSDVSWTEYPVTSTTNSGPFRITVNGDDVWFTERGANRIGRLNAQTGQIDEFFGNGLSPNASLADIRVAPNGWVWAAGESSDRLIRLVITDTFDYAFHEYAHALLKGPYDLAIESSNQIWLTTLVSPTIGRLTVSPEGWVWPGLSAGSQPREIEFANYAWFSDGGLDAIGSMELGTFPILHYYQPVTQPAGLASESDKVFWVTQQGDRDGALSRFVYTSTTDTRFDSYALPASGLRPTGIAVAADKGVWFGAHVPVRVFLPLVMREHNATPPLFSIQMYNSISFSNGFTRVVEAGAQWVRFPVRWSAIEPSNVMPANYNWAAYDASFQTAADSNVHVIATIDHNPAWAAVRESGPVTNIADLTEFVGAVVARYPQIRYWEFYNEPDHMDRFGFIGGQYAAMLGAVYPVVKSANPSARVVMGGLAMGWYTEYGGPFDSGFLQSVLSNCSGTCFDIANFHYYPVFRQGWVNYGRDIIGKVNYIRQILASYGFIRPMINTETSWPISTPWGNEGLHARYVTKVYVRSLAAGLLVTSWFSLSDADGSDPGLLASPDLTPRNAYVAYVTLTDLMTHANYVRTIPSSETGSPHLEGYQFSVPGPSTRTRMDVYWYDCPSLYDVTLYDANGLPVECTASAPLTINASQIGIISHLGVETIRNDIDDGTLDGRVTIPAVDTNPIYVDYAP